MLVLDLNAKNNQAGTSTCGTLIALASGQACLLSKADVTSAILSYFLWPPFPASLRPWRLPFYCSCSSESRRVAAHPCGPESPASVLWGILVSHCVPVTSAGAVESRGGEAWAVCALQFSPALSPGPVDQMSYSLQAERCCWDSLSPCSARPVQSCCQPAVKVEEASRSFLPGPAKGEGNSHVSSARALRLCATSSNPTVALILWCPLTDKEAEAYKG